MEIHLTRRRSKPSSTTPWTAASGSGCWNTWITARCVLAAGGRYSGYEALRGASSCNYRRTILLKPPLIQGGVGLADP